MPDARLPRFLVVFQSGCTEVLAARDLEHATERAELLAVKYDDPATLVRAWRALPEGEEDAA